MNASKLSLLPRLFAEALWRTPQMAPSENRTTRRADGRVVTEAAWLNTLDRERGAAFSWKGLGMIPR